MRLFLGSSLFAAVLAAGCSGTNSHSLPSGAGGSLSSGAGGSSNAGGSATTAASGGNVEGGANAGGSSGGLGGGQATGGRTTEVSAAGGHATGGASATSGTRSASGGALPAGGSKATGGTTASGGSIGTGGTTTPGGSKATSGTRASGGSIGTGGTTAPGGSKATGGITASGGSNATGGTTASGGATSAAQLVASWTLGWNLGNSLDADGCGASDETCWGNPLVTQDLLTQVAAHGFKAVRIPVTWSEHLGASPNYTIDATWMARVDTVVNYALTAGLNVIINLHHDGADAVANIQWLGIEMYGSTMITKFESVWTQIANHFKSYDNRLVFEAMNEIHEGYGTAQASWYTNVNTLDQDFVTTIRGTGGNNASRFLVVPGYNTNIDDTVAGFVLPTDTIANHLIVTYHYYTPYEFAINGSTTCWGAAYSCSNNYGQESYVTSEFDLMKTNYIDKGVPVIMGEYDATATLATSAEKYRRYWIEYVTKAAHDRGIAPFLWDAGQELFNRTTTPASIRYQDVMDCLTRATTSSYTLAQVAAP